MTANMIFSLSSSFYIVLIAIVYFSKKRIKTRENRLYSILIITNIIGISVELLSTLLHTSVNGLDLIKYISLKLIVIYFFTWLYYFISYVYLITKKPENITDKEIKIANIVYILFDIVFLSLPIYKKIENDVLLYTYGPCVNLLYIIYIILIIFCLIVMMKYKKNLGSKKYLPLYVFFILGGIVVGVQTLYPNLLLLASLDIFITVFMYHTIENPDVKMIAQLDAAKFAAEKANKAKSDFLSSMSHEIRTPLNAIVGFSEMIENEDSLEGGKENAKDIVLASHTLLEIVNGILDISKIEANKMEIVNKHYSLLPELENLSKLMIPRIGDKPIELKTQFAPDIPAVLYGDIGKIKQVITNILTNACKYTEKGEINFSVHCINENGNCSLIISVEDTGRGIKQEKINGLFTKFNRLDEDKNTTIEGTGLGLAITKSLVEMMGGKIIVQSVYGKGSKFTIYLSQKIVESEENLENTFIVETTANFEGCKVLVVDDNNLNLKVAEKLLKNYFISTVLVDDGLKCIDLIKTGEKFDLILMDDMMPGLRGTEVLTKLKEIEGFNIPTIALTANATTGMRESYIEQGFDDYLAKPIEKTELIKVLRKFLKHKANSNEKMDVLVVDDNVVNIKITKSTMSSYNFNIDEATSGKECIEKVKEKNYDIIFLDYMMPEMDGIETLNNLKQLHNFKSAVALTADAVDGSREKFLNAGFDEYIAKPIDKKVLDEVITKLLNREKQQQEMNKVEYLKENGIDVDKGLELLGDIEMYNETLKIFMEGLSDKFKRISNYKQAGDMTNYAIEVHGLKSDCKYLGFNKLADIAYDHELKSKENDANYIMEHFSELVSETHTIFNIVKKYFN